jgi:hypothetical protein
MHHYPLIGRTKYAACVAIDALGAVDPHGPISCPICRERLATQVAAKRDGAMSFPANSPERPSFLAGAAYFEQVLDQ